MNTEARQCLHIILRELMDAYADAPPWERVARLLADALDLATAPGVGEDDLRLISLAAVGLFKRAELARVRPAGQAPPQDAGVAAANEAWRALGGA